MKDKKMLLGITIVFLFLASVGFSYAYFVSTIVQKDVKEQVVTTGTLSLKYVDGEEIKMENIKPGTSITKIVYVTNTGTLNASYNLVWQQLINEITNDEIVIEGTCTRMNGTTEEVDGTCDGIENAPIKKLKIKENISIEPNIVHKYDLTITFKEINGDQNYNQDKNFSGVIGINEYKSDGSIYCSYNGEMVQGAEFVNGAYTYRYKQEGKFNKDVLVDWQDADGDGWGVQLTDKTSTNPIEVETCTYINNKPVIYASMMFSNSKASSIDLRKVNTSKIQTFSGMFTGAAAKTINFENVDTSSVVAMDAMFESAAVTTLDLGSFDTSNVTAFDYMFNLTKVPEIKGLENFNTSKATLMNSMFAGTKVTNLDLSNFDTSNVTNMSGMFARSTALTSIVGLDKFDTSKVTDMHNMFSFTAITTLDVSGFDTSKVTNMSYMFSYSSITTLDVSNFNTSNVTNMFMMFARFMGTSLDVSNFDTSNVTNMAGMFIGANVTKLDLSNFNTSKVTNMAGMFSGSSVTSIIGLDKFDTSSVESMQNMFNNSKIKSIDLSSFDTSNVTSMLGMFNNSAATEIIGLDKFNTSNVENMQNMFNASKVENLDLSSFDISKVTNMKDMFKDCESKTGYAKDEETASKFNDSSVTNIPSTLVFTVKQ